MSWTHHPWSFSIHLVSKQSGRGKQIWWEGLYLEPPVFMKKPALSSITRPWKTSVVDTTTISTVPLFLLGGQVFAFPQGGTRAWKHTGKILKSWKGPQFLSGPDLPLDFTRWRAYKEILGRTLPWAYSLVPSSRCGQWVAWVHTLNLHTCVLPTAFLILSLTPSLLSFPGSLSFLFFFA